MTLPIFSFSNPDRISQYGFSSVKDTMTTLRSWTYELIDQDWYFNSFVECFCMLDLLDNIEDLK